MNDSCSTIEPNEGCISRALSVLGNKWSALILRDMSEGPKRFSELEKSLVGISPRTLSQRLDDLEEYGIITKKSFAEVPPRVEYYLTSKGRDLVPSLQALANWGQKYACTEPKNTSSTN